MSECEAEEEMLHALHEWGVSENTKQHEDFRSLMLTTVRTDFKSRNESSTFDHLEKKTFPKDYGEATRLLFADAADGSTRAAIHDKIDLGIPGSYAPFRRWYNKTGFSITYEYKRSKDYLRCNRQLLSPFNRFEYEIQPKSQYWFDYWFKSDNDSGCLGSVFEAMTVCHAIHNARCVSCDRENSLRWGGGRSSSFQDLVCVACNSTYAITCKQSVDKIKKALRYNTLRGGSFAEYRSHINSITKAEQKMFMVIVPREVEPKTNQFPVTCLEIQKVLPALNPMSFIPVGTTKDKPYIKSTIQTNIRTQQKWFEIPEHAMPEEWKTIVKEVYISKFSKDIYDEYTKNQPTSSKVAPAASGPKAPPAAAAAKGSKKKSEDFLSKLDNLDLHDDWEALYGGD